MCNDCKEPEEQSDMVANVETESAIWRVTFDNTVTFGTDPTLCSLHNATMGGLCTCFPGARHQGDHVRVQHQSHIGMGGVRNCHV